MPRDCPLCGLVNPDTSPLCDCGFNFESGLQALKLANSAEGTRCPCCQSAELQEMGLAHAEGRFVARLLGGRSLSFLIYGRPAVEIRCRQCGSKFLRTIPRRKWTKWDDHLGIGCGLAVILAFVIFGILITKGSGKGHIDRRIAGIFAGATKVEVFRVDGRNDPPDPKPIKPGDPTVGGYAILSRGDDQGQEFAAKLRDILTDDNTYSDTIESCFFPGVAFRVWKGLDCVDVIICFKCKNFYVGPPNDKWVASNASFLGSPNTSRLIRLAKEAFPRDEEIQALKDE